MEVYTRALLFAWGSSLLVGSAVLSLMFEGAFMPDIFGLAFMVSFFYSVPVFLIAFLITIIWKNKSIWINIVTSVLILITPIFTLGVPIEDFFELDILALYTLSWSHIVTALIVYNVCTYKFGKDAVKEQPKP